MMYGHERDKSECIQKARKNKPIDILINKIFTINHRFQNRAFYHIDNIFRAKFGQTCTNELAFEY